MDLVKRIDFMPLFVTAITIFYSKKRANNDTDRKSLESLVLRSVLTFTLRIYYRDIWLLLKAI